MSDLAEKRDVAISWELINAIIIMRISSLQYFSGTILRIFVFRLLYSQPCVQAMMILC